MSRGPYLHKDPECLALRGQGLLYREIAERTGYSDRSGPQHAAAREARRRGRPPLTPAPLLKVYHSPVERADGGATPVDDQHCPRCGSLLLSDWGELFCCHCGHIEGVT